LFFWAAGNSGFNRTHQGNSKENMMYGYLKILLINQIVINIAPVSRAGLCHIKKAYSIAHPLAFLLSN
jgi:hypothetical protein